MSNEVRSAWDQLELVVGEEIARIGMAKEVVLRDELQFSIWPFLNDVVIALREEVEALDEGDDAATVPADLVAMTVALLQRLMDLAAKVAPTEEAEALRAICNDVSGRLMECVDQDDLAELAARQTAPASDASSRGGSAIESNAGDTDEGGDA